MENIYRELTLQELERAIEQKDKRTRYEREAYRLLPSIMKAKVERNPPIAFKKCNVAFFPDLFFREEKICIEIDGGYHKKRIYQDTYRDDMFAMYDFTTIRVQNLDIRVEVSFWQRLVEGMEKMNRRNPSVDVFIDELQQMIDREIRSWTQF